MAPARQSRMTAEAVQEEEEGDDEDESDDDSDYIEVSAHSICWHHLHAFGTCGILTPFSSSAAINLLLLQWFFCTWLEIGYNRS